MKLLFRTDYFFAFLIVLIIEILIATYISNGFIRHTFGDFLVVILLYFFLMSFMKLKIMQAAIIVLCISFIIEFLQLFNLAKLFQFEDHPIISTILGSTFSITDLVAYLVGIITVVIVEKKILNKN